MKSFNTKSSSTKASLLKALVLKAFEKTVLNAQLASNTCVVRARVLISLL